MADVAEVGFNREYGRKASMFRISASTVERIVRNPVTQEFFTNWSCNLGEVEQVRFSKLFVFGTLQQRLELSNDTSVIFVIDLNSYWKIDPLDRDTGGFRKACATVLRQLEATGRNIPVHLGIGGNDRWFVFALGIIGLACAALLSRSINYKGSDYQDTARLGTALLKIGLGDNKVWALPLVVIALAMCLITGVSYLYASWPWRRRKLSLGELASRFE